MAQRRDDIKEVARAMNALRRIVRSLRVSSRAVEREVGISGAQLFVLRQLADLPGGSLTDLVERTLTHQSTVSEVVARLVDRRLVSRRPAADDARRAELELTARGRAVLRSAPASAQSSLVAGFGRLGVTKRRALAEGLEAWLDASGLSGVEPAMFFERSVPRATSSRRARGARDAATVPSSSGSRAPAAPSHRATKAASGGARRRRAEG